MSGETDSSTTSQGAYLIAPGGDERLATRSSFDRLHRKEVIDVITRWQECVTLDDTNSSPLTTAIVNNFRAAVEAHYNSNGQVPYFPEVVFASLLSSYVNFYNEHPAYAPVIQEMTEVAVAEGIALVGYFGGEYLGIAAKKGMDLSRDVSYPLPDKKLFTALRLEISSNDKSWQSLALEFGLEGIEAILGKEYAQNSFTRDLLFNIKCLGRGFVNHALASIINAAEILAIDWDPETDDQRIPEMVYDTRVSGPFYYTPISQEFITQHKEWTQRVKDRIKGLINETSGAEGEKLADF